MDAQLPQIQIIQQEEEEAKLYLKDYYFILRRRWWIVLMAFVITVSLAFVYLARKPKRYTATALVRITNSGGGGGLPSVLSGFVSFGQSSTMATEIEMIKLRDVAEAAIRKLELDKKEQNLALDWEQIVWRFQRKLKVSQRGKSDLVAIAMTGTSATDMRDIVNEVAKQYVDISEASRKERWNDMMERMDRKLDKEKVKLKESRDRLHEQEAKAGILTAFSPILTGTGTSTGRAASQYMIPDTYRETMDDTMGRYGGLGIEISITSVNGYRRLTVTSTFEDTPADKAGLTGFACPVDGGQRLGHFAQRTRPPEYAWMKDFGGVDRGDAGHHQRQIGDRTEWNPGLTKPSHLASRRALSLAAPGACREICSDQAVSREPHLDAPPGWAGIFTRM